MLWKFAGTGPPPPYRQARHRKWQFLRASLPLETRASAKPAPGRTTEAAAAADFPAPPFVLPRAPAALSLRLTLPGSFLFHSPGLRGARERSGGPFAAEKGPAGSRGRRPLPFQRRLLSLRAPTPASFLLKYPGVRGSAPAATAPKAKGPPRLRSRPVSPRYPADLSDRITRR